VYQNNRITCATIWVAVYLVTHCNIGSKRMFLKGIPDRWQLFTYLMTQKLFSSCFRRYLVSHACDWVMPALSAMLLTVSNSVCFPFTTEARQLQQRTWFTQYQTPDGRCQKCGKNVSCTRRKSQGNDLELMLTVKLETKLPAEDYFGSEFRAICNHCRVMAACKSQDLEILLRVIYAFFGKKRPLMVKFSKLFQKFSPPYRCCVLMS